MTNSSLYLQDILTADQFDTNTLSLIAKTADKMEGVVKTHGSTGILKGKIMTALFYEPSSRTFSSFITSMQRLGGGFIPIHSTANSSVAKGETLADTVRTFANYSDIIVMRHPEKDAARIASEFCNIPVINAGDGIGEHPTQALLDYYTIFKHFPSIEGCTITIVGDLLNGRTVHSLLRLITLHKNVTLQLVSPTILSLPKELLLLAKKRKVKILECERIDEVLSNADVLYMTRVQKERFTDLRVYEEVKHHYILTPTLVRNMKKTAIIMHPLPRVGEISVEVDSDPRALYMSEQMRNGMYVRMALLALILSKQILE